MKALDLQTENTVLKQLLKEGEFYINYWSTDCDGCSSANWKKFTDIESLIKWVENCYEWEEGAWGWELTDKHNLEYQEPAGYWGM